MISAIATSLAARFAPSLVRRLMGDTAGEVAESVLGIARRVTGAQTPEEALAAIEADAEFQREFAMQAAELDLELEKAYLADRQDARDMRLELAKLGKTDWMMYAVAGVTVLGLVATVLAIFFVPDLTERQTALLNVMGGGLLAGFMSIIHYFFGSSRGSSQKTTLMGIQQSQERGGA